MIFVNGFVGLEARELTERTVERVGLEEKRDLDERWPPAPGGPGWKRDLDERWPPAPGGPGWKRDLDERWPPAPGGPGWKRDLDQH